LQQGASIVCIDDSKSQRLCNSNDDYEAGSLAKTNCESTETVPQFGAKWSSTTGTTTQSVGEGRVARVLNTVSTVYTLSLLISTEKACLTFVFNR